MGELRKYAVIVNGNPTVLKLTAADAERYPDATLLEPPEPEPKPVVVRRSPAKTRQAPNKARTSENK